MEYLIRHSTGPPPSEGLVAGADMVEAGPLVQLLHGVLV